MATFRFQLSIPQGNVFEGDIEELYLPTPSGEIAVFADHMPMVTPITTGVLKFLESPNQTPDHYAIESGILAVEEEGITLSVGAALHARDVDQLESQKELVEARANLTSNLTDEEVAMTEGIIERQMARIEAFERHQGSSGRH